MYQYYIFNFPIPNINKLKKKFNYNSKLETQYISDEGIYIIEDNNINKYILNNNINPILFHFYNYKFVKQNQNFLKVNKHFYTLPIEHKKIDIILHEFNIDNNDNFKIILKEYDNNIIDFYILSNLEHNDYNLKEDISYFIRMLM